VDDPDAADATDRDYWDFDEEEMQSLVDAARAEFEGDNLEDLEEDEEDEEDEGGDEEDDLTDPVAIALFEQLVQLPAAEIAGFDNIFEDVRALADTPDMTVAALLIEHGFLGDASFDDFRAGLVALGRPTFEAALANPDSLADHPMVREIATANDPRWLGREDVLFVASHAYAQVTGEDAVTFFDFAENLREGEPDVPEPEGEDWDVADEARTRSRLPKLSALFYERSMRNRRRALDRLGLPR
jgi:hypothetical protein